MKKKMEPTTPTGKRWVVDLDHFGSYGRRTILAIEAEAAAAEHERIKQAFAVDGDDPQHAKWTLFGIRDLIDSIGEP